MTKINNNIYIAVWVVYTYLNDIEHESIISAGIFGIFLKWDFVDFPLDAYLTNIIISNSYFYHCYHCSKLLAFNIIGWRQYIIINHLPLSYNNIRTFFI